MNRNKTCKKITFLFYFNCKDSVEILCSILGTVLEKETGDGGMEWRGKVNTNRPNLQHKRFDIDISKKLYSDKYSKAQE